MTNFRAIILALFVLSLGSDARASQGSGCLPTTGTVTGLSLVQNANAAIAALISSNSGASAPATDCSSAPVKGQLWLDTSTPTLSELKIYSGSEWVLVGVIDVSSGVWAPPIGGGTATLASATTTDLCSVPQSSITVSGSTTITSFSNSCPVGTWKSVTFSGEPEITYNATSMILPTAASISAAAGDSAIVQYLGGGNWRALVYQRADGTTLSTTANFTGAVSYAAPTNITVSANTVDWSIGADVNRVRATASGGSWTISGIADGAAGREIMIDNVGSSNNLTLLPNNAGSSAANRLLLAQPVILQPGQSVTLVYDETATGWRSRSPSYTQPVAGGFKSFVLVNGATPNSQMVGTADAFTLETTSGIAIRRTSLSCTADLTASGAGGLDTGTVAASTWYSYWFIYNPTTNTDSCLFSLSATAPTMPSGYTFKARGGWNKTNASTQLSRVRQSANRACFVVSSTVTTSLPTIISGTAGAPSSPPTWSSITLRGLTSSTLVPSTAVGINVMLHTAGASAIAAPTNSYGGYDAHSNPPPFALSISAANPTISGYSPLQSDEFYYASNDANGRLLLSCWDDNL